MRAVANAYREAFSGLRRPVWLLALVTFVNRSGTMVLPFMALYLTERRGFSATAAGTALGVYGLGSLAGTYLGGWLSDLVAPRRVMALSLLLNGAGFLILGLLSARLAILLAMFCLSVVGEAFRPASSAALVQSSASGERTRAFALNRLAVNLGMTFGPVAGGFLAGIGYGWLFVADGGTCLLAALVLWRCFHGAAAEVSVPRPHDAPPERSPWRDPVFLALVFLMTLLAIVFFQLLSTYPLTLRHHFGFSEAGIGLVLGVNTLVIALFEMVLVHSLRRFNPLKVVGLGSLILCTGFAILPLGSGFAYVAFTVLIWTIGEMLSLPVVAGVVADRAGEKNLGQYMGLFTLSFSAAFVLAPIAGTWVYQRLGPAPLWYGCGAVGVLLWGGFQALSSRASKQSERQAIPV